MAGGGDGAGDLVVVGSAHLGGADRGAAIASFGPELEMQIPGRVAACEPPHRVVFDGGEGVEGLTFEWTIDPHDDGTCTVRLHNVGFGDNDPEYEAMLDGWKLFMSNLGLHLKNFAGQTATAVLPMVMRQITPDEGWAILLGGLGIDEMPAVGDRLDVGVDDVTILSGTVIETAARRIAVFTDQPAPGTAFLTAEDVGGITMVCACDFESPGQHVIRAARCRRSPAVDGRGYNSSNRVAGSSTAVSRFVAGLAGSARSRRSVTAS